VLAERAAARVVAIHQPNFFPWLGYFDKLARADVFVVLDDAQFPKTGGTWTNRVSVRVNGAALRVTAPVRRPAHGVAMIKDIEVDDTKGWRANLAKTLAQAYARAPAYREVWPVIEPLIHHPAASIGAFNLQAIRALCGVLGLDPGKLVESSTLGVTSTATARLIELVAAVGGGAYLCGGGSAGYQEDDKFDAAGLALHYQAFAHPTYPQHGGGAFVPGLSILDALFELGPAGTRALLGGA